MRKNSSRARDGTGDQLAEIAVHTPKPPTRAAQASGSRERVTEDEDRTAARTSVTSAAYGNQSEARTLPSCRQAIATALAQIQAVGSA
jgi:hypothetical protein